MGIRATINTTGNFRTSVSDNQRTIIRTVGIIPDVPTNHLMNLTDVDASDVANNDTLVYNSATGKFEAKSIDSIVGGSF